MKRISFLFIISVFVLSCNYYKSGGLNFVPNDTTKVVAAYYSMDSVPTLGLIWRIRTNIANVTEDSSRLDLKRDSIYIYVVDVPVVDGNGGIVKKSNGADSTTPKLIGIPRSWVVRDSHFENFNTDSFLNTKPVR